jgi:hypothetical protein
VAPTSLVNLHGGKFVLVFSLRRDDSAASNVLHPRRIHMNVKSILGFAAIAGLLMIAAPTERAQALSLSSPVAAAAVQNDTGTLTTEVRYYHHHHWHHRHWHHHHWHRHHWHRHHWHHRHWHHHH